MGLYDNYKLSNSNTVQQFAGSLVPELKLAKDQADARYEQTQEGLINLPEVLRQAPVLDGPDRETFNKINAEAQAKIAAWSKRPDLENATIDVYRYSKQTGNTLKLLADQKAARDKYVAEIDKNPKLDPITKEWKIAEADKAYGGLKFDANGKPLNAYEGKAPVDYVDKPKKIREALAMLEPDGSAVVEGYDEDNHRYSVKTSKGTQWVSEQRVLETLASAKELDWEWKASDEQEVGSKLYKHTKNISDDGVRAILEKNPGSLESQEIQSRAERQGISLSDAYKEVKGEQIQNNMIDAEKQYARSKVFTRTSSGEEKQVGPNWESDAQKRAEERITAEKEAKEVLRITGSGPVLNASAWAPTIEDLKSKGIEKQQAVYDNLVQDLETTQAQLDKATETGDNKAITDLEAKRATLTNQLKVVSNTQNMYKNIEKQALDEAARGIGMKGVANFEQLSQAALPDITKEAIKEYPKGIKGADGKMIPPEVIAQALATNGYKRVRETPVVTGSRTASPDYFRNELTYTDPVTKQVQVYKYYDEANRSIKPITFFKEDQQQKSLKNVNRAVKNANTSKTSKYSINDRFTTLTPEVIKALDNADLGFVANDGVTAQPIPVGYATVERSGRAYQTTGLVPVRYLAKDGTVMAEGFNVLAGTDAQRKIGEDMMKDANPSTQAMGAEWVAGPGNDMDKFVAGNNISKHDDGKLLTYWYKGKAVPVRMDFLMDGSFNVIDPATNKALVIDGEPLQGIKDYSAAQRIFNASKYRKQ